MLSATSARGIQQEKQGQADAAGRHSGSERGFHFPWRRVAIAVAAGLLLILVLGISSPWSTSGSTTGPPGATPHDARAVDNHSHVENRVDGSPWWEGRTWAGEIDVCVTATADAPGCEWLAGKLIHLRCELKTYQTFAAALAVGASFDALHQEAVSEGDCRGGSKTSDGGRGEFRGRSDLKWFLPELSLNRVFVT